MITNNVPNVFNTPRLCTLSGNIKPLGQLKATLRETQLYASTKTEREKSVLALAPSQTFKATTETWVKEAETC